MISQLRQDNKNKKKDAMNKYKADMDTIKKQREGLESDKREQRQKKMADKEYIRTMMLDNRMQRQAVE